MKVMVRDLVSYRAAVLQVRLARTARMASPVLMAKMVLPVWLARTARMASRGRTARQVGF